MASIKSDLLCRSIPSCFQRIGCSNFFFNGVIIASADQSDNASIPAPEMSRCSPAALLSTVASPSYKRMLVRDYIYKSLYDPVHGYFSNSQPPVLQHDQQPLFQKISSRSAYQRFVATTYSRAQHGWMTPIELFSPYLSRAIANRIYAVSPRGEDVNIIEIGAGRGTLARDMLQHWSVVAPEFLKEVSYSIIEISSTLTSLQFQRLAQWVDTGHVRIFNSDARMWFETLKHDTEAGKKFRQAHCHVIGMEVLDNMPHDLVRINDDNIEQATILLHDETFQDTLSRSIRWISGIDRETNKAIQTFGMLGDSRPRPPTSMSLSTPSILIALRSHLERLLGGGKQEMWVPTGSYQLFESLTTVLPHAHLTIADFDSFPGALPGENGPIVQSVGRGTTIVYDSIQTAPYGKVDIMFPTNFSALACGHQALCEKQGVSDSHVYSIKSQQQFFDENAFDEDKKGSSCSDGYNPILQDFENASFLLADNINRHSFPSV